MNCKETKSKCDSLPRFLCRLPRPCQVRPKTRPFQLQVNSVPVQFSWIPLMAVTCSASHPLTLSLPPSPSPLLSFPPPPPYPPPSYYSDSTLLLPLSFASYSLSLSSSPPLLFLFFCFRFCFIFFVIISSASIIILQTASTQPATNPLLLPHYLTPISPRSLGDRHFLLLSAINDTVPSSPLRFRAPFMLLRPSRHSCLYPGVNWSF